LRILPDAIPLGVVLAIVAGAPVAAQEAPIPARSVQVRDVRFSGSGCLAGAAIESLDDSKSRATIIFSANTAASGRGIAASDARKSCEVALSLSVSGDEPESKVRLILRGHATLPPGASSQIENRWTWPGDSASSDQRDVIKGGEEGSDDNFTLTRELTLTTSSPSDGSPFVVETQVAMLDGREAFVTIDSLDVAIGPSPFEASFGPPDATPPAITATPSIEPTASGWYGGEVLVSFTCTDPESAIVPELSDLEPKLLQATGEASGKCVNVTGSTATAKFNARIDAVAPSVLSGLFPGIGLVARGTRLPSAFVCLDGESGIAGCRGPGWLDTDAAGLHTFSIIASDRAGHETRREMWYRVGDASSCSDEGWRSFSTPMFLNEDQCLVALQPQTKGQ
jgi:hypothetical protein